MLRWMMDKLWPSKLKNRIFISFVIVVFIPFTYLQLKNYNQIEDSLNRKISEQNAGQLEFMTSTLEDARTTLQNSVLQMEHDEKILEAFRSTASLPPEERRVDLQEKIVAVKNIHAPQSSYIQYTMVDQNRELYASYPYSIMDANAERGDKITKLIDENLAFGVRWVWKLLPPAEWMKGMTQGGPALSVFSRTSGPEKLGIMASIDLNEWLRATASTLQVRQNYYVLDGSGKTITQSASGFSIEPGLKEHLLQLAKGEPASFAHDSTRSYVFNAAYIPSLDWYVISQFPLDFFFGDIEAIKRRVFLEFTMITVFFVAVAFLTLSTLTRPLRYLEKKMKEAKHKQLNIKLSEKGHRGEILSFVRSFNDMIDNITNLIGQLKMEERQKESLRFQMLLSQMNPHFLLNTLNTIKWNAWNSGDQATAEMCKALGKLLESSLNTELDLVYLKDEMELLQAYVYIQSFRFDNAFETVFECDSSLDYALVPKLSLQPLVENAIDHGLVHRKKDGVIQVKIYRESSRLVMEIQDNGVGIGNAPKDPTRKRKGIGLSNLKERLALLFKHEGLLEMESLEEGTSVKITIPLLLSNPYHAEEIQSPAQRLE